MKIPTIILLFVSAIGLAQTGNETSFSSFKKDLEAYLVTADGIKPAACQDYVLKYIVKGESTKETVFPMNTKSLCDDLKKFDPSSAKFKDTEWSYEIKPVGDRYYIIRGDKKSTGNVVQIFYYYERKK